MVVISKEEGVTYSDLAGCYPIKSARGNQYILICYDYDRNVVLEELLPSRSVAYINKAVPKLLDTLTTSGHNPKLHIIDNQSCDILKKTLLKRKISYKLVSPHTHFRNAAERGIQTFKYHFIAFLCSTDTKYPVQEWE